MAHLAVAGLADGALLTHLYQAGHSVTLVQDAATLASLSGSFLLLLTIAPHSPAPAAMIAAHRGAWLAWNSQDDPDVACWAYEQGALAVLPAHLSVALVARLLNTYLTLTPPPPAAVPPPLPAVSRRYRRGDFLLLEPDQVLDIQEGIVALTVLHPDGSEVLLGLYGPGHLIPSHPADSCCLQLSAHTEATVTLQPWEVASRAPFFAERLQARLHQMEAWASIQARPYVEVRIMGLLCLLAEQFGTPHAGGLLLGVRLTHAHLASAIGAARTTVTRLLGELRQRKKLETLPSADGERYFLPEATLRDYHVRHTPTPLTHAAPL